MYSSYKGLSTGNMLFYYEEGNVAAFRVPDIFVVRGVVKEDRRVYKLWEEQEAPCVVFEITSRGTRREDLVDKRAFYEMLGVQEYYLFDPLSEYLRPQFQGYFLAGTTYQKGQASGDGSILSHELNLVLRPEGKLLRLVDPATGQPLPTMDEAVTLMADALEMARSEAQRAWMEAQRAEAEAQRAEAEAQRAKAAETRSDQLEAEISRLRRMLGELG